MRKNSNRRLRSEVRGLKAEIGGLKAELEELRSEVYDESCDACEDDTQDIVAKAAVGSALIAILLVLVIHSSFWNEMSLSRLRNDFMSLCGIVRVAAEPKEDDDRMMSWERALRGDWNIGYGIAEEVCSNNSEDYKENRDW